MEGRFICLSILISCVCSLLVTAPFTDAMPVQPLQGYPVRLSSKLTGQYVAISSTNDSVYANASSSNPDTDLVMEFVPVSSTVESLVSFRRQDLNKYITVTQDGKLKALSGNATGSGSKVFKQTAIPGQPYRKFSANVQYMPSDSSVATCATCYMAIRSFEEAEAPDNVCDVEGNDFQFQDDNDNLLFHVSYIFTN